MRTIYILLSVIFLACISINTRAQIVNLCASTDSISIHTGNFQYGTIEWETSIDNINWTKIEGAHDTVYSFFPTETRYYRAINKYSDCQPEYSEVTLVQMPLNANAGGDRIIPDTSVVLMGLLEPGSIGAWSVANGIGGMFSDVNNPSSLFHGNDSIYTLEWTVTNMCGTSTDSVSIQFKTNDYINDLVVVDLTDTILSDSAQMANGNYQIIFSLPAPTIGDSTILVGLAEDGFLRRVQSYSYNGDTVTMQTEQATLEDITIDGAFDLAQVFDIDSIIGGTKSSGLRRLNKMPTRAELLSNPMFKSGNYYYIKSDSKYTMPGVTLKQNKSNSGSALIDLEFNDTLFSDGNTNLELNGSYVFTPNLQADLDYSWLNLNSFRLGLYNAIIERDYELILTASASSNLLDEEFTLLSLYKDVIFVLGSVPVWVRTELKIDGQVSADVAASMTVSHEYNKTSTYTAAIEYENDQWDYIFSEGDDVQVNNSIIVTGDLTQTFDIGPNITFKIYNIVGPYVDARLTEDFNLCLYNTAWQANLNVGGELTVGAKAEVIKKTLFDVSKTWSQGFYHLQFPHKLEIISGNNQSYALGSELPQPIKVKVSSNKGFSVPLTVVHFSPQNGGTVDNSMVITDGEGYAQTYWTPGGNGESYLEVSVNDCSNTNITNSPVLYTAYEGVDCSQSSLSVYTNFSGNDISPTATMGTPPYSYSTDGVNYSTTVPIVTTSSGNTYVFYVQDANGCLSQASYTAGNPCMNSNLSLSISAIGNSIQAIATGGTAPYSFALDVSTGNFSSVNVFNNVLSGSHTVYVKDAIDCIASADINISLGSCPSTVSDYDGNTYNTVLIGEQCWMKQNLKTTHYSYGTSIPNITSNSAWAALGDNNTDDAYCYYDNLTSNANIYGALYTWTAAMGDNAVSSNSSPSGVQGICPDGWHIPSDNEWKVLEMELGMSQSEVDASGWRGTNQGSQLAGNSSLWNSGNLENNASFGTSDFTALPAGGRNHSNGSFGTIGDYAHWWSSTEDGSMLAWHRVLMSTHSDVLRNNGQKSYGYPVRCVKDNSSTPINLPTMSTSGVTSITQTSAICSGEVLTHGAAVVSVRGFCWNTTGSPTISDDFTTEVPSIGTYTSTLIGLSANTTYYVRAYATNSFGTAYGSELQFSTLANGAPCSGTPTVTDYDGNIYNTIQIGNQCWMKENLKTTHYANGDSLTDGTNAGNIAGDFSTKYHFDLDNSPSNTDIYGKLYTWAAVMNGASSSNLVPSGVQGVCPSGWHVPSDEEWKILEGTVDNTYDYPNAEWNGTGLRGTDAGLNLKSTSQWIGTLGTDTHGFSALPGGDRYPNGTYYGGAAARFWTSTQDIDHGLDYSSNQVRRDYDSRDFSFSLRCVRDNN